MIHTLPDRLVLLSVRANLDGDELGCANALREAAKEIRALTAKCESQRQALLSLENGLTIADYEEEKADHRRLVRELDVLLNGDGAARQASLCDIVAQVKRSQREFASLGYGGAK